MRSMIHRSQSDHLCGIAGGCIKAKGLGEVATNGTSGHVSEATVLAWLLFLLPDTSGRREEDENCTEAIATFICVVGGGGGCMYAAHAFLLLCAHAAATKNYLKTFIEKLLSIRKGQEALSSI